MENSSILVPWPVPKGSLFLLVFGGMSFDFWPHLSPSNFQSAFGELQIRSYTLKCTVLRAILKKLNRRICPDYFLAFKKIHPFWYPDPSLSAHSFCYFLGGMSFDCWPYLSPSNFQISNKILHPEVYNAKSHLETTQKKNIPRQLLRWIENKLGSYVGDDS